MKTSKYLIIGTQKPKLKYVIINKKKEFLGFVDATKEGIKIFKEYKYTINPEAQILHENELKTTPPKRSTP